MSEALKTVAAKDVEAAVRAWQLYIGRGAGTCRISDEQKLYNRAQRAIAKVAKKRNMDVYEAERQITNEARRRGGICPLPGKDI